MHFTLYIFAQGFVRYRTILHTNMSVYVKNMWKCVLRTSGKIANGWRLTVKRCISVLWGAFWGKGWGTLARKLESPSTTASSTLRRRLLLYTLDLSSSALPPSPSLRSFSISPLLRAQTSVRQHGVCMCVCSSCFRTTYPNVYLLPLQCRRYSACCWPLSPPFFPSSMDVAILYLYFDMYIRSNIIVMYPYTDFSARFPLSLTPAYPPTPQLDSL